MRAKACAKHGTILRYSERYDTCYCLKCDEWTETKCKIPECFYCSRRPDEPSKAIDEVYK